MKANRDPVPCRRCRAAAIVEPEALGWSVKCTVMPGEHCSGSCSSREKAVQRWNAMQAEAAP